MRVLFKRIDEYGVVINLANSVFVVFEIKFFGYRVTIEGITPLVNRVDAIVNVHLTATVEDLRIYFGTVKFYRRLIPGSTKILQPLSDLLKGTGKRNAPFEWPEQSEK